MEILQRGAEALLTREGDVVTKKRLRKGYRVQELDQKIRTQRTKLESRILIKAKRLGIDVPRVLDVQGTEIRMEFLEGERVKELLSLTNATQLGKKIGEAASGLHNAGIMHGDLTTSNMILKEGRLYLIDFGLAKSTSKVEDQAVDLFLLYEALKAGHFKLLDTVWGSILNAYKRNYSNAIRVLSQLETISKRRRYKSDHEKKKTRKAKKA